MTFKMKGPTFFNKKSPMKRETAQSRKDKNDPLLRNIKDTSQKGDEAVKPKPKSSKIGPVQSPEARKKIRANVTKTRKTAEASGKSGTIFDATDKTLDANEAAMNKDREARKYVKN